MGSYYISGGRRLSGEINVSGAKNAILPILAASVTTRGENVLTSCPRISDVDSMLRILRALGCAVRKDGSTLSVDASGLSDFSIPKDMMSEMRSSVFLAGALLARCGEAVISDPGGCDIGKRPIDIHVRGLRAMGAAVDHEDGFIRIRADKLTGADIRLDYPSVGATENIMLAAAGAEGVTVIRNSAREPEIEDLQKYMNRCGGHVKGAGTGVITVEGKRKLSGCRHDIMPDRIEAGTYLIMAPATRGEILLRGIDRASLDPVADLLEQSGCGVGYSRDEVWARSRGNEKLVKRIRTAPYPGFPTDMQPQLTTLLTKVGEGSIIEENIFDNRMEYAKQLKKMGADIAISEKKVIIKSNNILCGADVEAKDLRGGAALVIAGLMAEGDTVVRNTRYIKRGYSRLEEKIRSLGGEIRTDV